MKPPGGCSRSIARKNIRSYTRSFGVVPQELPLMEYDYDAGLTNPNQVSDGYYMGCRGYTIAEMAIDEDETLYDIEDDKVHKETYDRMSAYEGHGIEEGGQLLDAMNFAVVAGVLDKDGGHVYRGKPYLIEKLLGLDWFDSHRIALRREKASLGVGTIFFQEWMFTPAETNILTDKFTFDGTWDTELGHMYKVCGEKTINWEPYLISKMWTGRKLYFSRATFNKAFDIWGTASYVQVKRQPRDTLYVRLTMLQRIVQLLARYISESLAKRVPQYYL